MALDGRHLKKLRQIHGSNKGQKWRIGNESTSLVKYAIEGFKM